MRKLAVRARRLVLSAALAGGGVLAACGDASSPAGPGGAGGIAATPDASGEGPGVPCDVDAVLERSCRSCHGAVPRFGAPMPLVGRADFLAPAKSDSSRTVGQLVAERIAADASKRMPPPPTAPLAEEERVRLGEWASGGAPGSDATCTGPAPSKPTPTVGCTPDLTLAPASAWTMPKQTRDEYVCYGVDLAPGKPTHLTAFEPRVDNAKIVHHIVLYEAPSSFSATPQACSSGGSLQWRMVMGWAPGGKGMELPKEAGYPLSPDGTTHLVVQLHYSNITGLEGETDRSGFDVCTEAPRPFEADIVAFGTQDFTVPATNQPFTRDCTVTVPESLSGIRLFAAMPHMHEIGTSMSTVLERPGAPPVDLGTSSAWSFGNQPWFAVDAQLQKGDVVRTRCTWTNKTGSPVPFGEKTQEEMCYSFTMYYPRVQSSLWSWAVPALSSSCL